MLRVLLFVSSIVLINCCNSKWEELVDSGEKHTFCEAASSKISGVHTVTDAEKKIIVDHHNELRGKVSPSAGDMLKIYWDDELASVAQKHAELCEMKHDCHNCRKIPSDKSAAVGQNLAAGAKDWKSAIDLWWDEVKDFTFGVGSKNGGTVGHYTQLVNANATRIGCGFATCSTLYKRHYSCNYLVGQFTYSVPYQKSSSSCSSCPNSCKNNMCDCQGLKCKNGGTLDRNTCQCQCTPFTKGHECEIASCGTDSDKWYCGTQWPVEYCKKYSNVKFDCPKMCGMC
ncbi:hypothetical protein SNEBB_003622 [Seison nebaliae]|nr:hypothetical protein SNEBB_003622 [Seison nebaliae]